MAFTIHKKNKIRGSKKWGKETSKKLLPKFKCKTTSLQKKLSEYANQTI